MTTVCLPAVNGLCILISRRMFEWLNRDRFHEAEWCFQEFLRPFEAQMQLWRLCPAKKSGKKAVSLPLKDYSFDRRDPFLSGAGIADSLSAAPPFSLLVAIFESWGHQRGMREPRF